MTNKPISNRAFSLWSTVVAVEGGLTTYFLARIPSEIESAVAFGLSSQRLLIVTCSSVLTLLFLGIAIIHLFHLALWNEIINKKTNLIRYILALTVICGIITFQLLFFIPKYHFPVIYEYISRLKPVLIWFLLIFVQAFIFLTYYGFLSLEHLKNWHATFPILITLVIIGLIWGLIAFTGIGVTPDNLYWNIAGVPLLSWQVWAAIGIILVVWFILIKLNLTIPRTRFSTLAVFIGIWIISAILWIKTPMSPTFNAPGPYLPSSGFYPFVDAAFFDLGAQSALFGKGIFFGAFIDRGLLMGFLAFIHMVFGQNYSVTVGIQSAVYAVFPALLYLLGKKLHSKAAGLIVAILAALKVSNAIAGGKWISNSHPKLLLTEFPTGIILIFASLFLVYWLISNNSKPYFLAGIGAVIGIGILLRTHVLFLFPVILIFGLALWKRNWRHAPRDIFVLILAFFITISPWMWRNQQVAGEPLFFMRRFDSVIEDRYEGQSFLNQRRIPIRLARAGTTHASTLRTENNDFINLDQYQFIPKHFVHNIITSVLVLPPSPVLDDLRHTAEKYPYWGRIINKDERDISVPMGIFLAINLIILSIGLGSGWKRIGFVSLAPLVVFLFYNLANAFARTSGGRYIVPIDWVIYFYYSIGLIEIVRFSISTLGFQTNSFFDSRFDKYQKEKSDQKLNWKKTGLVTLPFFLLVLSLPLIESTSPGAKQPESPEVLIQQLDNMFFFDTTGLSQTELKEFLKEPGAILLSGHGFYPRYYIHDQGEPIFPGEMTPYTPREFPRLVFTLLLPDGDKPIWLPYDNPRLSFPDAAEVIVAGCQVIQSNELTSYFNYIDTAFVVVLDDSGEILMRSPEAPLTCPLQTPVCDNNHNCK